MNIYAYILTKWNPNPEKEARDWIIEDIKVKMESKGQVKLQRNDV